MAKKSMLAIRPGPSHRPRVKRSSHSDLIDQILEKHAPSPRDVKEQRLLVRKEKAQDLTR